MGIFPIVIVVVVIVVVIVEVAAVVIITGQYLVGLQEVDDDIFLW